MELFTETVPVNKVYLQIYIKFIERKLQKFKSIMGHNEVQLLNFLKSLNFIYCKILMLQTKFSLFVDIMV